MGSQLISCTGLLLARIHEITAADYSCTFALLARRPLLNSFAVPAYVRLVIRHVVLWLLPASALLFAQAGNQSALRLDTGEHIYKSACVACHGPDGRGTPKSIAGFEPPDTFPDFTRCDQTTAEPDSSWKAIITHGGHYRGFSQIMPSFSEALSEKQIDQVIRYLRGFCKNPHWPRGELN